MSPGPVRAPAPCAVADVRPCSPVCRRCGWLALSHPMYAMEVSRDRFRDLLLDLVDALGGLGDLAEALAQARAAVAERACCTCTASTSGRCKIGRAHV